MRFKTTEWNNVFTNNNTPKLANCPLFKSIFPFPTVAMRRRENMSETTEQKVDWLMESIAVGQRLAFLWDGGKKAYGFSECFKVNDYWRIIIEAHVTGSSINAELRGVSTKTTFTKKSNVCLLGLYYGGDTDEGDNECSAYSLDCDESDVIRARIMSLPVPERLKDVVGQHISQEMKDNEAARRREMMAEAMKAFPSAMFFSKPNGKWHAYGRLIEPRPAKEVKRVIRERLPKCCEHIEVFPKSNQGKVDDRWYNANQVRLPFGFASNEYLPVGDLRSIGLETVDGFKTYSELDIKPELEMAGSSILNLPIDARIKNVKSYCDKIGDVGTGERHNATFKVASCALKDNQLSGEVTTKIVTEFNLQKCCPPLDDSEIEKQVQSAGKYGSHAYLQLTSKTVKEFSSIVPIQPARPVYIPPSSAEIRDAINGTPLETYGRELRKISPLISADMILADAMLTAGLVLAKRGVCLGTHAEDHSPIWTSFYVMKLAESGGGKGRTSQYVMKAMTSAFNLPILGGESEASILATAEKRGVGGIYYKDEIRKIIDPDSCTARQICNTFLGAWDNSRLEWITHPKGETKTITVSPAYPSLLVDGQPSTIENYCGRGNVDAGLSARFLISCSNDKRAERIKTVGFPDLKEIVRAYQVYDDALPGLVLYPIHDLKSKAEAYQQHMTSNELSAWGRLAGQYIPKIALILEPTALKTGKVSAEALNRAGVIVDYYFKNTIKFLDLIHDDKASARRAKAARYIAEHNGCAFRDLYRYIGCNSNEMLRDILPTLVARGDINVDYPKKLLYINK